jgi:hypothetical protein
MDVPLDQERNVRRVALWSPTFAENHLAYGFQRLRVTAYRQFTALNDSDRIRGRFRSGTPAAILAEPWLRCHRNRGRLPPDSSLR